MIAVGQQVSAGSVTRGKAQAAGRLADTVCADLPGGAALPALAAMGAIGREFVTGAVTLREAIWTRKDASAIRTNRARTADIAATAAVEGVGAEVGADRAALSARLGTRFAAGRGRERQKGRHEDAKSGETQHSLGDVEDGHGSCLWTEIL